MSAVERAKSEALAAIVELRAKGARVHCITNTVAQNFTANVLLACGATPSMTVSPDEAAEFTSRSDALLVNLGTLSNSRRTAIRKSLQAAIAENKPVVLDPVMCQVSHPRLAFVAELMKETPEIVRANSDEIAALEAAGIEVTRTCRVLTGRTDHVCNNEINWKVDNGHVWMTKVTAIGCAQGGLIAALAAKSGSLEIASLAGLLWTNIAGEIAAENASGPGTFQAAFIDALHGIAVAEIENRMRVS